MLDIAKEQKVLGLELTPPLLALFYFLSIKVMHARSGGSIEVMGMMQGKVQGNTIVIMDAFALPVEGTETRVNAQAEGYEYMVQYITKIKEVRLAVLDILGWLAC